jgi:hypothetical protein
MTFNFDGCTNCPTTLPFNATRAPNTFTAPMDSDRSDHDPGHELGITLNVAGLDVITASLGSSLTLAPAPRGWFPGSVGRRHVVQVTGASGAPSSPSNGTLPARPRTSH